MSFGAELIGFFEGFEEEWDGRFGFVVTQVETRKVVDGAGKA